MQALDRLDPEPLTFVSSRLAGKVIFVTGASTGIGAAAVKRFAAEGASVVAASRRLALIEAVVEEVKAAGGESMAIRCDVRDEASVQAAIAATVERYGRLDGAFNNAGMGGSGRLPHQVPTEAFDQVIATNLRGPFLCMKYEIAQMIEAGGGSIVNTSSIGGLVGGARNADYGTSKWGLIGLTKCAAVAYAEKDIRVNAIAPASTHSEMFHLWLPTPERRAEVANYSPMKYIAHPDDMARAALFLLSDEARWITGIVLPCDGGSSAD